MVDVANRRCENDNCHKVSTVYHYLQSETRVASLAGLVCQVLTQSCNATGMSSSNNNTVQG